MRKAALAFLGATSLAMASLTLVPPASAAATRYASPSGTGTACTQMAPCSLPEAVTNAVDGDTVQLTAEEYLLTSTLSVGASDLTIQGPAGQTTSSSFFAYLLFSGVPDTDNKVQVYGNNVHFQRLAISGTTDGSAALIGAGISTGTTYDRVLIHNNGPSDTLVGEDVAVSNSSIQHTGLGGLGSAVSISGSITGSTIYSATGTAINVNSAYLGTPYCSLSVANTVAWGAAANMRVDDLSGGTCTGLTVDYDYSWIPDPGSASLGGGIVVAGSSTPVAGAHNLSNTPAVFDPTDPASTYLSNLVLPVGSPAIDAGCTGSACSDHDYYGRPRPIGTANDIGAMEQSLAPVANRVRVEAAAETQAALTATLRARGAATTYAMQIRRTGTSAWTTAGSGTVSTGLFGTSTVSATALGLAPGTSYDARLSTRNDRGSATSGSLTVFRTAATPVPATIRVHRVKALVTRRAARLKTALTASVPGRLTQKATTGTGRNKQTRCRSSLTTTLPGRVVLTCTLGKKARKELRTTRLKVKVVTSLRPSSGATVSKTSRVTIRRKR